MSDTPKVKALASMTINLGNYESAKIEAGIELPVSLDSDVKSAFENAWKEVYRQLEIKTAEIKRARK